jgi:thiamine biosynthesis lipoprotein
MGMPSVLDIVGAPAQSLEIIFTYFDSIDEQFSPYKPTSEVSRINRKEIRIEDCSPLMRDVLLLAQETKEQCDGYFDVYKPDGTFDPSGIVKGWAIKNASDLARREGHNNFWLEIAGDIEVAGRNAEGRAWSVGIKNPFNATEVVKVLYLTDAGIATSGTYVRGDHIYNPFTRGPVSSDMVSISVVGSNVYEADRFATAAFAMGDQGVQFIESIEGLEGYAIDNKGFAIMTSGFSRYAVPV